MLKGCTALKFFDGSHNQLVGDLEPLQGCTVNAFLQGSRSYYYSHWSEGSSLLCCSYNPSCIHPQVLCKLNLAYNGLTGGLEPLRYAKGSSPGLTHATTHAGSSLAFAWTGTARRWRSLTSRTTT